MSAATQTNDTEDAKIISITENDDGSVDAHDGTTLEAAPPPPAPPADAPPADDARARSGTDDDDDDVATHEDDVAAAAGATEADREAIRARRRQERQDKKTRQRLAQDEMRRELHARDLLIDDMRRQLDVLNRRSTGTDLAQIDERINQGNANVSYLEQVIADGTAAQNGVAVAKATVQLQKTMLETEHLKRVREQLARSAEKPQAPQLDPRIVSNAVTWMKRNTWYNPAGADADSRIVLAIDNQLAQEGFDPQTPAYWQELDSRVKRAVPNPGRRAEPSGQNSDSRDDNSGYNGDANSGTQRKPSRSVVTGGSSSNASPNGAAKSSYRLSPERVQALKEAGAWDDPARRSDAIRRFREFDAKSNDSARR